MFDKERELVEIGPHSYNLKEGGSGGWDYVNGLPYTLTEKRVKVLPFNAAKASQKAQSLLKDENYKKEWITKISKSMKLLIESGEFVSGFQGKTHSDRSKEKISQKSKIHQSGEGNSQFGTMWITDGSQSKKIKNIDQIPEGWSRGRKIK